MILGIKYIIGKYAKILLLPFFSMVINKVRPRTTAIECGDITRAIFAEIGVPIRIVPIRD